jgi:DNA polymerase-3 subunit delta'
MLMIAPGLETVDLAARNLSEGLLNAKLPHPDFVWVAPEGKLRQIKVDPMRELRLFLQKASLTGIKVAHISECDRLNDEAANLFLKILEEPPEGTYIILTTTQPHAVLPTILSRTMRFRWSGRARKGSEFADFSRAFEDFISEPGISELERVAFASQFFLLWQGPEEKALLESDPTAVELSEEIRDARLTGLKKEHRRAMLACAERVIVESFKKQPRSGAALKKALEAVERVRRLMEFSFNEAAGFELLLTGVQKTLSA